MSIQRVIVPQRHYSVEEFAPQNLRPQELTSEFRHDARQSVATILALVAAARGEVADHERVLTRFEQVARQAQALGALLDESETPWPQPGRPWTCAPRSARRSVDCPWGTPGPSGSSPVPPRGRGSRGRHSSGC